MQVQIIKCKSPDLAKWNAFVEASPHGSFYHRAEWQEINERSLGHRTCYLAAVSGGRFVGVFPIVRLKSALFGNIACSLPFVNYGGPCAESEAIEQSLLEAGGQVASEWSVDYLEVRSRRHLGHEHPSSTRKVSLTVDLDPDPEKVFNAFKSDHRKDIRRSYKYGFTARFGTTELFDDFYAVLSESWRDLGTPLYSDSYLKAIIETFPRTVRICMVYDADGVPAAGAFVGHQGGIVEGMWLGTRARYRRQMVGYVLYWELIKDACEGGHRLFHLGRSTADSGAEVFKKKWNARSTQLYWHYLLRTRQEIPQLNVANRRFQFAMAAWRKLPVGVTKLLGPMISRSIP